MTKGFVRHISLLTIFIFASCFIWKWLLHKELSSDQFIGFVIGILILVLSFFIKKSTIYHEDE